MTPDRLRPPDATGAEIRRRAREILSRPEFQPKPKTLYQRAVDFLSDRLDRVLRLLLGGGRTAILGWIIIVAVLALVAFLIIRLARNRITTGATGPPEAPVETERRRAVDWRNEASAHEQRGEWRLALRCRYRALVADLAGRGVVEEIPGRTTGEYRAEVWSSAPAAVEPFTRATRLFERAWYGNLPADESQSAELRDLSSAVLERV